MNAVATKISELVAEHDASTKTAARRQYEETYRRLRTAVSPGMTTDELRSENRQAAHNASRSIIMKRRPKDKIEYMQIRLANAKERARIRKSNEKILSSRPDLENLYQWLSKSE